MSCELNPETDPPEIVITNRPEIVPLLMEVNGTMLGPNSASPKLPPGRPKTDANDKPLKTDVYVPRKLWPS
jgi:hypothetical protein